MEEQLNFDFEGRIAIWDMDILRFRDKTTKKVIVSSTSWVDIFNAFMEQGYSWVEQYYYGPKRNNKTSFEELVIWASRVNPYLRSRIPEVIKYLDIKF